MLIANYELRGFIYLEKLLASQDLHCHHHQINFPVQLEGGRARRREKDPEKEKKKKNQDQLKFQDGLKAVVCNFCTTIDTKPNCDMF